MIRLLDWQLSIIRRMPLEILPLAGVNIEARSSAKNTPLIVAAVESCSGTVWKQSELCAEVSCHTLS